MRKLRVNIRDKEIRVPNTVITLFDIKNAYIATGELAPEFNEDLFILIDFLLDRLLWTESERFRNNY